MSITRHQTQIQLNDTMKTHDMEISRHRAFQTYWQMHRRSVVLMLNKDKKSKLCQLPTDIIKEILRQIDANITVHCFKRAQTDELLCCQFNKQTRADIPNLRWLAKQDRTIIQKFRDSGKYWRPMQGVCAWSNISRWYMSGEGCSHQKQILVYENTTANPCADKIRARLNAIFGPAVADRLFVVRNISACGRSGTQVVVCGRGVPRCIIDNDVLFANFSVLHGVDKRITPLNNTAAGNCIYM